MVSYSRWLLRGVVLGAALLSVFMSPAKAGLAGQVRTNYEPYVARQSFGSDVMSVDIDLSLSDADGNPIPQQRAYLSADAVTGTFKGLLVSRRSGGAMHDLNYHSTFRLTDTESFVLTGASTGDVGYLRFSLDGAMWSDPLDSTNRPWVIAGINVSNTEGLDLSTRGGFTNCLEVSCDPSGNSTFANRIFELEVPLVNGVEYAYGYSLEAHAMGDATVDISHTAKVYFELPSDVGLVVPGTQNDPDPVPVTFLSQQTYIPPPAPVPEPESYLLFLSGLGVIGFAVKRFPFSMGRTLNAEVFDV